MLWEKLKQERKIESVVGCVCHLKRVDRKEILAEKMTFEQRLEGREGGCVGA